MQFWRQIVFHWRTDVACDLHEVYGIDLDDWDFLRTRDWGWLRARIEGLLDHKHTRVWRLWASLLPKT